ncbi:aminopeptidase 2 [Nemania sp. FL0031]|nr:aminopeptidase 2 [Nemania sp. FL0031]
MNMSDLERKQLPRGLKPTLYELCLEPDYAAHKFAGHVSISCDVVAPSRAIELHSKFIAIQTVVIESRGVRAALDETAIMYDDSQETVKLSLDTVYTPGESLKVELAYVGQFKDNLEGLYQSKYTVKDENGIETEHRLAVTSLEPTYARQVFPCFDEPELKAEFIISAIVDQTLLCRSNMPIERTYLLPHSKKLVVFQKTVSMSTYLVAFVSGALSEIKSEKSRIPLSAFCPIGTEKQAEYALDLAATGLQLFEELFDSCYPLPKLDLVAVPDFSGAMENWGLIIFKTTYLLLDPEDSALETKQLITETMLHELSHMWFGNLVTMKYWDGLWLKEGFATLMAWMATDKLHPAWKTWDKYVSNDLQSALESDSLKASHPVEVFIADTTDAKQIYDRISYKKGCCVLKMISNELGWDQFLSGIKLYLDRNQYGSTESEDLWSALQEATGDPIKEKMHMWTKETGYPVVTVTEVLDEETGEVRALKLRQDRFIASGVNKHGFSQQIYPLRIGIRSETGVEMVEMRQREITLDTTGKTLLKVNADHDGFFRTAYSASHLQKLARAAVEGRLSLRDSVGLLCDLRALVGAGITQSSDLLDGSLRLRPMTDYLVWDTIDHNLQSIRTAFKFSGRLITDALNRLARDVLGTKAHELGWVMADREDDAKVVFKSSMFSGAGLAGDQSIVSEAKEMFSKRVKGDEKAIPASLRYEVFGIVAKFGGREDLEALLGIWTSSSSEEEKYLALECLGRAGNAELVRWVLSHAFTNCIKDPDLHYLIWVMGSSEHGALELWGWFKQFWDRIQQSIPIDLQSLLLGVALDGLGTAEHLSDAKEFFARRDTKKYVKMLDQKLESLEIKVSWAERDTGDVKEWLTRHGYLKE